MRVFLDIECGYHEELLNTFTGNIKAPKTYKDQEKIDAYILEQQENVIKKMTLDVDYSRIKFIGLKVEDNEPFTLSLSEFINWHNEHRLKGIHYISYNGKSFDFRVIIREAIKLGLGDKSFFQDMKLCLDRYSKLHTDLMKELCDYGEWKSLDLFAQIYLGKSKEPINFETCSDDELIEHNKIDLEYLQELYKKFEHTL